MVDEIWQVWCGSCQTSYEGKCEGEDLRIYNSVRGQWIDANDGCPVCGCIAFEEDRESDEHE
jgi:hypothetical protein